MGYSAVWLGEAEGREAFAQAGIVLAATHTLKVATGIASIWARDAVAMANGGRALAEAWPERFILGVGVSHSPHAARRGHSYRQPVTALRTYLESMNVAPYAATLPSQPAPVVLSALGPRMLALARDKASGAYSFFVPPTHTRVARELLGPGSFLAAGQAVVPAGTRAEARQAGSTYMRNFLALDNYRLNLERLGWAPDELGEDGSDQVFDSLVAWGDEEQIAKRVREHLAAGADHVVLHVLPAAASADMIETLHLLSRVLVARQDVTVGRAHAPLISAQ
jgi:probable F420-dependent oxidoreductase